MPEVETTALPHFLLQNPQQYQALHHPATSSSSSSSSGPQQQTKGKSMSWLKGQPRPLAATGNMVFGRLTSKDHLRHSSGDHMFSSQRGGHSYDKDALQGLLEGVRTSTYGQRMRSLEQSGRLNVTNRRGSRGRSVDDPNLVHDPRRGRTSTPIATRYHANHHRTKQDRVVSAPHGTSGLESSSNPWNQLPHAHQQGHAQQQQQVPSRLQNLTLANGFGFRTVREPSHRRGNQNSSQQHSQQQRVHQSHMLQHGESQSDVEPMLDTYGSLQHARGGRNHAFHQSTSSLPGLSDHGHPGGPRGNHRHENRGVQRSASHGSHGNPPRQHPGTSSIDHFEPQFQQHAAQHAAQQQANQNANANAHVIKPRAFGAEDANPGFRPAMEDAFIIKDNFGGDPSWSYYGCYDGHGGKAVVDYTLAHLHEIFLQELQHVHFAHSQIRGVFERSFQTIDTQLRHLGCAWHCGTTCTVGLIYTPPSPPGQGNQQQPPIRTLFIGNVGDSRASLVNSTSGGERLTVDHKASDPAEHARVTAEGGVISRGRVGGQLMLTRALGDFAFKTSGVTCKPYYAQRELKPDDVCVCLATDGLWDVLDEDDVARIVLASKHNSGKGDKLRRVASNLCDVAKNRGSADNITTCVVFL
ncbi:unnamed protein product [Amoebophrya sp. A120]|nr:unnamed protein product [Amoebophrya sp. A120]|eukprot:GSA120T00016672001.1